MAGNVHGADRFKPRVLRRLEVERNVRPGRLETVDASPERLLRILRADALEQGDDLLRLTTRESASSTPSADQRSSSQIHDEPA
jgi:hypothetical protein